LSTAVFRAALRNLRLPTGRDIVGVDELRIEILGSGCASCNRLEAMVREVVAEMDVDAEVEKVTDMARIMAYGVMSTPGLVIDGNVTISGRVPTKAEVNTYVVNALASQ
jgi:small redox-active disulfide protein 2